MFELLLSEKEVVSLCHQSNKNQSYDKSTTDQEDQRDHQR